MLSILYTYNKVYNTYYTTGYMCINNINTHRDIYIQTYILEYTDIPQI